MTKQQENRAFVKMLKEFPKAFGRVSFRERLMLKTAFTYVLEARYEDRNSIIRQLGERCNQLLKDKGDLTDQIADIKANCDLAIEGRDVKIMELEQENNKLLDVINNQDVKIADLEKQLKEWQDKADYLCGRNTVAQTQDNFEITKGVSN